MYYETLVDQVKTLPEVCLEEVSRYIDYVKYQYNLNNMNFEPLNETEEEFNIKMQKGLDDARSGRVQPLKEAFAETGIMIIQPKTVDKITDSTAFLPFSFKTFFIFKKRTKPINNKPQIITAIIQP